ncbi:MAG: helix-turn-helix transcriptional regulator [Candidatus Lokiarchaeota archaeon]|nr:helix-turn-helix transcriptional regulator [Candidatus Lokiarchaeota archaeon]
MPSDEPHDDLPPSPRDDATLTRLGHDTYLKAVNNPVRRRLLELVSKAPGTPEAVASQLVREGLLGDEGALKYHLDVLAKARCVDLDVDPRGNVMAIKITQGGQVVDYMEK